MIANQTLLSSQAIPTTNDSRLLITLYSNLAANTPVDIRVYLERPDGTIEQSFDTILTGVPDATYAKIIQLSEGRLIAATVSVTTVTCKRGDLFAQIVLLQGSINTPTYRLIIASGYITSWEFVNYPSSGSRSTLSDMGGTTVGPVTAPAPGGNFNWTPPIEQNIHLLGFTLRFTTDANVAVRTMVLSILIGGIPYFTITARTTQIAALVRTYQFWPGPNLPADTATVIYLPFPHQLDCSTISITSAISNVQAGDQIDNIFFAARQLFDPNI